MTDELITVASSAPMALRIHDIEPNPDADKPDVRSEASIVINGSGHPDAVGGLGITHNVNAGWFSNWMTAHPHLEGILRVMTPDEFKAHAEAPAQFGFEPGLAKLADDKDNAELASKGTEDLATHDPAKPLLVDPVHEPIPPAA